MSGLWPKRIGVAGWACGVVVACTSLVQAVELNALDLARKLNEAFVEVADKVSPSVVVIQTSYPAKSAGTMEEAHPFSDLLPPDMRKHLEEQWEQWKQRQPEGPSRERGMESQGSGVVLRPDGYILTNRHVVEGANKIKVRFQDGSEYPATLKGEDSQSDIAVIKVEASGLPCARMGDSAKVRVGDFAIAIGAPFELDYSVTFGHVSAKGRSQLLRDMSMDQDFIQTDANINPGNSGGPLVNIEGEVIGINTLIRGLHSGIGFAIPISLAVEVADKLIAEGRYVRSWLGIGITALRDHRDLKDLARDIKEGVVVTEILDQGPAHGTELRANDIITAVDGQKVSTATELKAAVRSKEIGKEVTLSLHRLDPSFSGKPVQVRIKTAAWPEDLLAMTPRPPTPRKDELAKLGIKIELLTKDLADHYGVAKSEGVIVTEVAQNSPADLKKLRPGDIITEVNQEPVATPKQFRDALRNADLRRGVILNFTSRGANKFEILKESGD